MNLLPGRSRKAYATWLGERDDSFPLQVKVAALIPLAVYKTTIEDKLDDADVVVAFHVVKLGTATVDDVRRRVEQDTLGHRGHKDDPFRGVQTILLAAAENLSKKQRTRPTAAMDADPANDEVFAAWQCA